MRLGPVKILLRNAAGYAICGLIALASASCGGGGGSPGTVPGSGGATAVGSVSLIFSSPELKSAGTEGSEVTVTALVKGPQNNAMGGIDVKFAADSGSIATIDAQSDQNGQAKATLGTSGDRSNRKITVTAQAGGKTASGSVDVVGTSLTTVGPTTISAGGTGDFTISVKDSANVAVVNVPVSLTSQKGNPITVKTSNGGTTTAPLTNSQGQVVITVTASQSGNDTLVTSAQGVSNTSTINVNASKLTVSVVDGTGNAVASANTTTSCQRIAARYEINGVPQNGIVNINTSRGNIYSDSTCVTPKSSSATSVVAGDSQPVYLKSDTAGVATVTASIGGGSTAQTNIEFVAVLTPLATISLQAEPAVIGTNTGTGQSEKSTLTAVVRDGTPNNNFVKNAQVEFSVVSDKSGGSLSNPSVLPTASNGAASVTFFAGTADTSRDGVVIQAKIQGTTTTATATLTVSKKSLFISAGTGNKLGTPSQTTYQQDYSVFVADASGNAVPNATVTATIFPTRYAKGRYTFDTAAGAWIANHNDVCRNEDEVNRNGVLDAGEDFNSNGILDPGIPLTISSSGTTDANGTATISILYPRDRGNWIEVQLTIRGSVSGTESIYQPAPYWLTVLSQDVSDRNVSPPGEVSPYGVNACNIAN